MGGTYPPGARCSASPVGAGPRPARRVRHPLSFSPTGPGFPSLRPRRGGPRGRPPGSVYLSLRAALAAARPAGPGIPFPSPPWDVPRPGPRPQRFRVIGIADSRKTAGAHCAPLRKDGNPVRRADNIRPYDKTGTRRGGRMISAPTKSGYPVWGTVHIRPRKVETRYRGRNVSARRALFPSPVGAGPRPARRTRHPFPFAPVGAAFAAARRVQYTFPSTRPRGRPPMHSLRPLGVYPGAGRGPSVSASEGSWTAAKPRAHTVRPYARTGARCGGRMISAPTKKRVPNTAGG